MLGERREAGQATKNNPRRRTPRRPAAKMSFRSENLEIWNGSRKIKRSGVRRIPDPASAGTMHARKRASSVQTRASRLTTRRPTCFVVSFPTMGRSGRAARPAPAHDISACWPAPSSAPGTLRCCRSRARALKTVNANLRDDHVGPWPAWRSRRHEGSMANSREQKPVVHSKKHIARLDRERRQTRLILAAFIGILVIVVGLLIYGYVDMKYLQPRRPVAEIGDTEVSSRGLADAGAHGAQPPDQSDPAVCRNSSSTWAWT